MTPTFRRTCAYMGTIWFNVSDDTGTYSVALRVSVGDYELSIANGDTVRRDMRSAIGILHREHSSDSDLAAWRVNPFTPQFAIPAAAVDAFNAWRAAEHAANIAFLEANPQRYGVIAADDSIRKPPMVAVVGHYVCGTGWIRADAAPQAVAA